jgi:hypothetical protein
MKKMLTARSAPKPRRVRKATGIQTVAGKGLFLILRLYGPLQPWFDKTWQPDDVVLGK